MESGNMISTQAAAYKLWESLKSRGYNGFTLRPWNRFKPEDELWWLVPTTDWPSYEYAKIVIYKRAPNDGFDVGIHFEKGYSSEAATFSPFKGADKLVLGPDWIWHTVVRDINSGKFAERMSAISEEMKLPLSINVYITAVNNKDPDGVTKQERNSKQTIQFVYQQEVLRWVLGKEEIQPQDYNHFQTIEDLSEIFLKKEMEWFWIDLQTVFNVAYSDYDNLGKYAKTFVENYRELF